MRTLFALAVVLVFAAAAGAQPLPPNTSAGQAHKVDCPCGPRCDCAVCGCGLVKADVKPLGYADLYALVSDKGGFGHLYVGGNYRITPLHTDPCAMVPSGFGGFADGVYKCYQEGGKPVMKLLVLADAPPVRYMRVCGPAGCQLVPAR